MNQKICSFIAVSLCCTALYAADIQGNGTEANPYIITNAEELASLNNASSYYVLGNDIDLSGISWTPVEGFTGQLDGRGHSISNVEIKAGNKGWSDPASIEVGIFGSVGDFAAGTVTAFRNLTVRNVSVELSGETNAYSSALCGVAYGTDFINVTIDSVKVTSTYVPKSSFSLFAPDFGAVAGEISNGSRVINCTVRNLDYVNPYGSEVGGVVGSLKLDSSIEGCYASGKMTGGGSIGGIVGLIGSKQNTKVSNCQSNMIISAKGSVGGIVGSLLGGTVTRCYSQGELTADGSCGGVVGYIDSGDGLSAILSNCVSTAVVNESDAAKENGIGTFHAIAGWTNEDSEYAKGDDAKHVSQGVSNCYTTNQHIAIDELDKSQIYIDINTYYTAHEGTKIEVSELKAKLEELEIGVIEDIVDDQPGENPGENPGETPDDNPTVTPGEDNPSDSTETTNAEPIGVITGSWNVLNGPDGKTWFYTQEMDYGYTESTITIYDEYCKELGSVKVKPEFGEGVETNVIEPFGTVTTHFFDNDPSTIEIMVYTHGIRRAEEGGTPEQHSEIFAVSLNGDKVWSTKTANDAEFYTDGKGYDRLLVHESGVIMPQLAHNFKPQDVFHIMSAAKDGNGIKEDASFFAASELFYYGEGPIFNIHFVDNHPYYSMPHFEKLYATLGKADEYGQIANEDITVTPDNHFIVELFDGLSYEKVANLSVSTDAPEGCPYRVQAFNMFSNNDLSKGKFSNDGKFNFVITNYDYSIELDDNLKSFVTYDEEGKIVAEICDSVVTHRRLADIEGMEEQYMFVRFSNGQQEMVMRDVPSCEEIAWFGAVAGSATEGMMQTSSYVDRYPVDNSYQYCMGMTQGDYDKDRNVVTYYGWFGTDGELDHWVKSSLSPGVQNFIPLVTGESLDPHAIYSDDQHEYLQIVKEMTDKGYIEDAIYITNDEGKTLQTFRGSEELGSLYQATVFKNGNENFFLVSYAGYDYINDHSLYTMHLYALPFDGKHGGETVIKGDVNGDGVVNVFDVVAVSDYILNGSGNINVKAADFNDDNEVNVFDVVGIADSILGNK